MHPLDTLDTPAAVLDVARLQHNLTHMQQRISALGVALRPHIKTSKCLAVVQQQLALGLEPEALGLAAHRIDTSPFFARWTELRRRQALLAAHFNVRALNGCADCNGCRNDCPINLGDPSFVPNAAIRRLAAGDLDGVIASRDAWKCHECYTCHDRCCQQYSMMEIFRIIKQLSMAHGVVPGGVADGVATVRNTGTMIAGSEAARKRLKLPAQTKTGADELARLLSEGT